MSLFRVRVSHVRHQIWEGGREGQGTGPLRACVAVSPTLSCSCSALLSSSVILSNVAAALHDEPATDNPLNPFPLYLSLSPSLSRDRIFKN